MTVKFEEIDPNNKEERMKAAEDELKSLCDRIKESMEKEEEAMKKTGDMIKVLNESDIEWMENSNKVYGQSFDIMTRDNNLYLMYEKDKSAMNKDKKAALNKKYGIFWWMHE